MSSNSRAAEYRVLIEEILADDAANRALGLPGLDLEEIQQMRDLIAGAQRKAIASEAAE